MAKATKEKMTVKTGEQALAHVDTVTLNLDDGTQYEFSIAEELSVPDDADDVQVQAAKAPARLAFWDGQMERSLYAVRMAELKLDELEGKANKQVRLIIDAEREGELVAESAVQAGVDCRKDVVTSRENLANLRYHYGLLRSIRDAASHRVFVLNRLLDTFAASHSTHSGHSD